MSANNKKTEIKIHVELDENNVPEIMSWDAPDGGVRNQETKAFMLSMWDSKPQESMSINLWTKDMPVDEMKVFYHQTLVTMAENFERATGDKKMTDTMRDFCDYFAEKLEITKK